MISDSIKHCIARTEGDFAEIDVHNDNHGRHSDYLTMRAENCSYRTRDFNNSISLCIISIFCTVVSSLFDAPILWGNEVLATFSPFLASFSCTSPLTPDPAKSLIKFSDNSGSAAVRYPETPFPPNLA